MGFMIDLLVIEEIHIGTVRPHDGSLPGDAAQTRQPHAQLWRAAVEEVETTQDGGLSRWIWWQRSRVFVGFWVSWRFLDFFFFERIF